MIAYIKDHSTLQVILINSLICQRRRESYIWSLTSGFAGSVKIQLPIACAHSWTLMPWDNYRQRVLEINEEPIYVDEVTLQQCPGQAIKNTRNHFLEVAVL